MSKLRVLLETDCDPNQTSWELIEEETGGVMLQGGPYNSTQQFDTFISETCVRTDPCIVFRLRDSVGDGFCFLPAQTFGGSYRLFLDGQEVGDGCCDFGSESTVRVGNVHRLPRHLPVRHRPL